MMMMNLLNLPARAAAQRQKNIRLGSRQILKYGLRHFAFPPLIYTGAKLKSPIWRRYSVLVRLTVVYLIFRSVVA